MLFIKALWDKIQNYVIVSAFVYGGIMTTLYYHSITDLKEATSAAQKATAALQVCTESKDKLEESKDVESKITTDQEVKLRKLEGEKDSLLEQLANIPRSDCKPKKVANPESKTQEGNDEEVDIDGKLPDDLNRLLKQSYYRSEGESGSTR